MEYYPAVFTLGRDRFGRPTILYSGDDRLEALETLYRAISTDYFIGGRVVRADGSRLFVVGDERPSTASASGSRG